MNAVYKIRLMKMKYYGDTTNLKNHVNRFHPKFTSKKYPASPVNWPRIEEKKKKVQVAKRINTETAGGYELTCVEAYRVFKSLKIHTSKLPDRRM